MDRVRSFFDSEIPDGRMDLFYTRGDMRSPTAWQLPLDKRFALLVLLAMVGCAYPIDEFADGGGGSGGSVSSTGGKNTADGGSVNPGSGGASSTGGRASGGESQAGGSSASGGAASASGGAVSSGGSAPAGGATSSGGTSSGGAVTSGGATNVGGAVGAGGAAAGGATGAGGGPVDPSCTCDLKWVSAQSIPAQDTGDCMGYMDMLYRYEPENADSHMTYCDPNCPPPTSGSENCKWHAKLVLQGPCP